MGDSREEDVKAVRGSQRARNTSHRAKDHSILKDAEEEEDRGKITGQVQAPGPTRKFLVAFEFILN